MIKLPANSYFIDFDFPKIIITLNFSNPLNLSTGKKGLKRQSSTHFFTHNFMPGFYNNPSQFVSFFLRVEER